MYNAKLVVRSKNDVVVTVEGDGDDKDGLVHILPMNKNRAINFLFWLNGMADCKGPFEIRVNEELLFLHYEVWYPIRERLDKWYEDNHANS